MEARLSLVESKLDVLETDNQQIRARLAERGTPLAPNPERRRPKLTSQQHAALRRHTAAMARAAKPVGSGMGAVKSAATKRRLESEAGVRTRKPK